ncbi:MAG: hypothetical protein U1E65_33835 [Myxococcota bacterium]
MRFWPVFVAATAIGCGGGTMQPNALVLSDAYDITGVARVLPDGSAADHLVSFRFAYQGLVTSGGSVVGKFVLGSAETALHGDFEAATGNFSFMGISAALTASASQSIDQIGGTGFDGTPTDAVADDLTGFVRARLGARVDQGQYVAATRRANRPDAPSAAMISIKKSDLGAAAVTAPGGTFPSKVGVELFTYGLAPGAPSFTLLQAEADGSLSGSIPGNPGDIALVRMRQVGVAGVAVPVTIQP